MDEELKDPLFKFYIPALQPDISLAVLHIRIRDPESWDFWTPDRDPGRKKYFDPGSKVNILDHISESLITIIWVKTLEFFVEDPDPGSGAFWSWTRDSG